MWVTTRAKSPGLDPPPLRVGGKSPVNGATGETNICKSEIGVSP